MDSWDFCLHKMLTDGLWITVMFLSDSHSDGTHSLLSIHCWEWRNATFLQIWWRNKLISISDGLGVSTFIFSSVSIKAWWKPVWVPWQPGVWRPPRGAAAAQVCRDSCWIAGCWWRWAGGSAEAADSEADLNSAPHLDMWQIISTWAQISPAAAILPRRVKHQYTNISDNHGQRTFKLFKIHFNILTFI